MNKIMKKLPIWLLVVWPYAFFIGMLVPNASFFGVYFILTIVLCVMNIVNACSYTGENNAKELSLWGMVMKLVHMPFYVAVALVALLVFMALSSNSSAVGIPPIVLFLLIAAFTFMITSSVYCAKGVMAGKMQGIVKKDTAMILAMCSFIFVSDVVCSIIIYSNIKRNKKIK